MALNWSAPIVSVCRTGKGVEGYTIVYPFHGSLPGNTSWFTAIYHSNDGKTDEVLGNFGDIGIAQFTCEQHYNGLPPK